METVVISGISGSFPNSEGYTEFQRALTANTNLVTDQTINWTGGTNVPSYLGRMKDLYEFDHLFLSINTSLAKSMDSSQKNLLKHGYAVILDAGYSPADVRGQNIACYMTTTLCDDEMRNATNADDRQYITPVLLGLSRTMLANRISAFFNFHGPSVSYHANFENTFTSLKQACAEVGAGKLDGALVGVSNLCINPQPGLQYQALGLLTDEPVSRPLDDNASGYVRADCTVILFIQRKSDARHIYGEIVNIGNEYFGSKLGTFQSRDEKMILKLLEKIYRECNLKPSDVCYLETGSWANKALDTQELRIIQDYFLEGRTKNDPLLIGSVVGHTGFAEAAAPFLSLVKCIIALSTGVISPTLNVTKPNSLISQNEKVQIVTEPKPCKDYVAINAFGITGGFSHLILKKSETKATPKHPLQDELPRLYMMAARSMEHTKYLFDKLKSVEKSPYLASKINDVFGKEIRGYIARCFAIHPYKHKLIEQCQAHEGKGRPVWFLFSGMGSQWKAMGKDLMRFPVFASTIQKCHDVLFKHNLDLINIVTNEEDNTIFDNILNSFVGITAVQLGLVDLLFAMNIRPDGLIGHSVGELACAYADGCLSLEQVMIAAFARGAASKEVQLIKGMMAAVGLSYKDISPFLPPDIDVACRNSAFSCTISGPQESVLLFVEELARKGIFAKAVNVSNIAYHSRYIQPAAPLLLKYLQEAIPTPVKRSPKWISTSIQVSKWGSDLAKYCSAEYFTNNLVSSVYFEEGIMHIPKNAILIEIAPHGLLQPIVKKALTDNITHISLTNRSKSADNIEYFLEAVGRLYLNGCEPDINAIYPKIEYPLPCQVPSITQFITWDTTNNAGSVLNIGAHAFWSKEVVLGICSDPTYQHILENKIDGDFVIPIAIYIDLVTEFFLERFPNIKNVMIENLKAYDIDSSVLLKEKLSLEISLAKITGYFEIICERYSKDTHIFNLKPIILASGTIATGEEPIPKIPEWNKEIGTMKFNDYLTNLKYSLPEHQCVDYLTKYVEGFYAEIKSNGQFFDLIDSCLKMVVIEKSGYKKPEVPYFIRQISLDIHEVRSYKEGKSVHAYFDPETNQVLSSAIALHQVKTRKIILEDDEDEKSRDYDGPLSYFSAMKHVDLENIDVHYVGLSPQISNDNAIVDYSGVTKTGENIMGVVSYVKSLIQFDDILAWTLPSTWSLEDAVTVPLMYSMAYLTLVREKGCFRSQSFIKNVLIQSGDTPLGEACIAVALSMNKNVFTTVGSQEGRKLLQNRFPKLSPRHIFDNSSYSYFLDLMLETNGEGVNIVINSLRDEQHMEISWNVFGQLNGEFIQIGVDEEHKLCMANFLKCQSFVCLNSDSVLSADESTKKQIRDFIKDGIIKGFVTPNVTAIYGISSNSYSEEKPTFSSYSIIPMNIRQQVSSQVPTLDVNKDCCYPIIGGKFVLEVCEWLMERGARKFLVEFNSELRSTKIAQLINQYGAVVTVSKHNTNTLTGTEALIQEARALGDIAAIFAVNLKDDMCVTKLKNITQICNENQKSNIFLASLLCAESYGWHCEINTKKLNAKISDTLSKLDLKLKTKLKYNSPANSVSDDTDTPYTQLIQTDCQSKLLLDSHLPMNPITDLLHLHLELAQISVPQFQEHVTLSRKAKHVVGVTPVFFLPGLGIRNVKKIMKNMFYASFVALIPVGWTMEDIVVHLYKNMKQIQSGGVYTLVGESWGGVFALKLGEYLEKQGDTVRIIFLDASTNLLKDVALQYEQIFAEQTNLVKYIGDKNISTLSDFHAKNDLELSCKVVLDRVKQNVGFQARYKFKGECCVVTSKYSSSNVKAQYKMFQTISSIFITEASSPFEFPSTEGVVRFINENIGYNWW